MFRIFIFTLIILTVTTNAYASKELMGKGKDLSPVYEEMWTNEIKILAKDLKDHKLFDQQIPFSIVQMDGNDKTLIQIAGIFNDKEIKLKVIKPEQLAGLKKFQGIIFLEDVNLEKLGQLAAQFSPENKAVFFIVITDDYHIDEHLEEKLARIGLKIFDFLSLPELEYLKNEEGRQVINFDTPQDTQKIFEHLVREGMNPVNAHTAAEEAIINFRKMKDIKLFILSKK